MKNLNPRNIHLEEKISCVIPTYNRCPEKEPRIKYNPLWWSVNSLNTQPNVGEIIIVNDGSGDYIEDYTDETVKKLKEYLRKDINLVYIKNKEREGSGESRNIGVDAASYNKIFFYDDDCILAPFDGGILPFLQYTFETLKKENISAITLPVSGNSLESRLYPSSLIGKVDRKTGLFHGIYAKFPTEYAENPEEFLLDRERGIFKPLKVELMGGVFLCDKEAYEQAGGFPKTKWENACAEEPELMLNLQRKGYSIFYLPPLMESYEGKDLRLNTKFRVLHLRFGDSSFDRKIYYPKASVDGISLKDIVEASSKERRQGHGNRVKKEDELYFNILSNTRLLFKYRDIFGGQTPYNHLSTRYFETVEYDGRLEIFKKAVKSAIKIMIEEGIIDNCEKKRIEEMFLKERYEKSEKKPSFI